MQQIPTDLAGDNNTGNILPATEGPGTGIQDLFILLILSSSIISYVYFTSSGFK